MDPYGLPKGDQTYSYGPPRPTGVSAIDFPLFLMKGFNQQAVPTGAQSPYDAYVRQARARQFFRMQQEGFGQMQAMRYQGINANNPYSKMAGGALDPNTPVMQGLSHLSGGNPALAQMQYYAGLTGVTPGAFGMTRDVSARET